jgi:hypothetical protein
MQNPLNDPEPEALHRDAAKAVIEDGAIVIRVPIANLQAIMDGGFACAAYDKRYQVTNPEGFAVEIAHELNNEDEEGSTPIHKLFDAAINEALNQGAQYADEHPQQEF